MTDDDKLIDDQGNVDEEELERRVRELGLDASPVEEARDKADKIDDEFAARLDALEEKAKAHRQVRDNQQREEQRRMASDRESAKGLGMGLTVAYTLIGLPLVGVLVGWLLDEPGSNTYKGIGVVAGVALAIFMTVFLLSRADRQP
jgi:F0F1-type ATP synthase assembly protein I